jgi:exodeoxyribonuclease-5
MLYRDLTALGIPILYVGDMCQLEPIGENPQLMLNPPIKLTKVHRQAEKSAIIRFSRVLREGQGLEGFEPVPGEVEFGDFAEAKELLLTGGVDQAICGYNKTRHELNALMRAHYGFKHLVDVGDKLICLRNNKEAGIFNGQICTVLQVGRNTVTTLQLELMTESGEEIWQTCEPDQFGHDAYPFNLMRKGLAYFDYGYAVTAHKAMGSEWDRVVVFEEVHDSWEFSRWAYTSVTRASKFLFYAQR